KSRAEYRSYCERICGGDPSSVEDTLSLQLERTGSRTGSQYDALAGDTVVGLASISMTLVSRRRLAVNGTVESIGRLLASGMCEGGRGGGGSRGGGGCGSKDWNGSREAVRNLAKLMKNLSSVPEAHRRLSSRPILPLITRLWQESRDEGTSKLACHILANLSRSDVHDVRNRLFRSHLAAESKGLCRNTAITASGGGGGTACTSPPTPAAEFKHHPRQALVPCEAAAAAAAAAQRKGVAASVSSSVFCRGGATDDRKQKTTNTSSYLLLGGGNNKPADPVDLLDMQQRLRMTPSALWGERANLADDAEQQQQQQRQQQQYHATMARGESEGHTPVIAVTSLTARRTLADAAGCGGGRITNSAAGFLVSPALGKDDYGADSSLFPLPVGEEKLARTAASLKRPVVTSSVPLRWQSRVVTLSSLQDHGGTGGGAAPRNDSSASGGKRRIRTKPRLNQRSTKKRQQPLFGVSKNKPGGGYPPPLSSDDANINNINDLNLTQKARKSSTYTPPAGAKTETATKTEKNGRPSKPERKTYGNGDEIATTTTATATTTTTSGGGGSGVHEQHGNSTVGAARPSTAPMHSDGKVVMRPLEANDSDRGGPPSVVFEPGFSRLRTRRVILDRVYRFTRHEENTKNPASTSNNYCYDAEGLSQYGSQACYSPPVTARPATSPGVLHLKAAATGAGSSDGGGSSSSGPRNAYPNTLQPWKPPLLFQFCKDPGKTGERCTKETIILEPTSPTTHFVFTPAPHETKLAETSRGEEAEARGPRDDDKIRLDRFEHIPGCSVCRGSLGHVKVCRRRDGS
ncbi:unnamed protein product, partial [Laminaria digitata]